MRFERRPRAWLALAACVAAACGGGPREEGPVVTVVVEAAGLTGEELERMAAVPVERALAGVGQARALQTVSVAGHAVLAVELAPGADVMQARRAIAERLAEVSLPDGIRAGLGPLAARGEVTYVLRSPTASLAELRALQDWVIGPRLRAVPGVVDVAACGGALPVVEIVVSAERLRALDLAPDEIAAAVSQGTGAGGGGVVTGGTGAVLVCGSDLSLDDLGALRVGAGRERAPVLLRDVAEVRAGARPPRCQALVDGVGVVAGAVRLRAPSAARGAEAALREARAALPSGAELDRFARADGRGRVVGFRIATPPGDDAEAQWRTGQRAARALEHADGVARVLARMGHDDDGAIDRLPGEIDVLVELEHGSTSEARLAELLRSLPGVTVRRPAHPRVVRLLLSGDDRASLAATAGALRDLVAGIAGVEVAVTLGAATAPQTTVSLDRARLASLGLEAAAVTDAIAMATEGVEVGSLLQGERAVPVIVRWAERGRDAQDLGQVPLRAPDGTWVGLGQVATIQVGDAPVVLLRAGGRATTSVWIELAADGARAEIRRRVAAFPLPPGQVVTVR